MGTSNAFGGSSTQPWTEVGNAILAEPEDDTPPDDSLSPADETTGDDEPHEPQTDDTDRLSEIAALIAQALQSDDPSTRPRKAPTPTTGDSGLSLGYMLGRPRLRGSEKDERLSGGRRQITLSAGRAGRALGAAYALAAGNAAGLASYGLDLDQLAGMSRFDQIYAILDCAKVGNSGPDDLALRRTLGDALNGVLDDPADVSPVEAVRDMVCMYAIRLFEIELDALVQRDRVTPEEGQQLFEMLRPVIDLKAARLKVDGAVLSTPRQFDHAARQLMRAALEIVRS